MLFGEVVGIDDDFFVQRNPGGDGVLDITDENDVIFGSF